MSSKKKKILSKIKESTMAKEFSLRENKLRKIFDQNEFINKINVGVSESLYNKLKNKQKRL